MDMYSCGMSDNVGVFDRLEFDVEALPYSTPFNDTHCLDKVKKLYVFITFMISPTPA